MLSLETWEILIKDFSKSSFNGLGQRMNGNQAIKTVHSFPNKAVYEKK